MGEQREKPVLVATNETVLRTKVSSLKAYTTPKLTNFGTLEDLTKGVIGQASKPFLNSGRRNAKGS